MRANDMQVGGSHYKGRATQHWDVIDRNGIGYLEGVATKYLCRWREKNGLQDLEKAEHYVVKLMEEVCDHDRRPRGSVTEEDLRGLREAYDLEALEYGAVRLLLTWSEHKHLEAAHCDIRDLIMREEQRLARSGEGEVS
jgi:hypothetical protein